MVQHDYCIELLEKICNVHEPVVRTAQKNDFKVQGQDYCVS